MEPCSSDRNQTSMSVGGYGTLAVFLGVSSVVGVVLNLLVIVITVRHRQLRQPLSYALVNLAVCDLGCALFGGLPTTVSSALGHFHLGRVGCTLEGFTVAFFGKWRHMLGPGQDLIRTRESQTKTKVTTNSDSPDNQLARF